MSERAFVVTYFGTGTAPDLRLQLQRSHGKIPVIRRHAKSRHGIAPKGDDDFLIGRCNMHQTGIIADHQFGLAYQVGAFIQFELSTGIVNLDIIYRSDLIPVRRILRTAEQDDGVIQLCTELLPFMHRPALGAMGRANHTSYIPRRMGNGNIMHLRFFFHADKIIQPLPVILYPEGFHGFHITVHNMQLGQQINLEGRQDILLDIEFVKREGFFLQRVF